MNSTTDLAADTHGRGGGDSAGVDQRASRGYRADIDGLRALAVLPIVLFHLGVKRVSGGFIGVDIFFVISGYLIGGALLGQVFERRYSLADFYARRFRRIIPALVATLAGTTVAMAFVALPGPMIDYARSLVAAMLSVSNIFFWQSAGYFDAAAESKPLLHTWSLGVEEQFYVLFPLIVLATRRAGRRVSLAVLGLIALASFAVSCWGVKAAPTATFYLLHTRIWELLAGVLASQVPAGLLKSRGLREALAAAAFLGVAAPIFLYTSATPFPGLAAAAPCLATAVLLVVGAQGGSLVSRGFAIPPAVFIGLISYSLYLWHWPVIVLLREGLPVTHFDAKLKLLALVVSLGIAWLSWRFVERPLRSPAISRRAIFLGTLTAAGLISAASLALVALQGVPARFPPETVRLASYMNYPTSMPHHHDPCWHSMDTPFSERETEACLVVKPGMRNVLLFGDSHANHLRPGLAAAYPDLNIREAASSGCTPLLIPKAKALQPCRDMLAFMFGKYLPAHPGGWVIVSANWNRGEVARAAQTVDWLNAHGFHVILSGPVGRYRLPLSELLALSSWRHDPGLIDRFRAPGAEQLDAQFAAVAAQHGVRYLSPYRVICPAGAACRTLTDEGVPVQWDQAHLTHEGALMVAKHAPLADIPVTP